MPRPKPKHPGTITFIDGKTNKVVSTRKAADLPESIAYAETRKGWVPVVKVVALQTEDVRFIREYSAKGELLRATQQIRPSTAAAAGGAS